MGRGRGDRPVLPTAAAPTRVDEHATTLKSVNASRSSERRIAPDPDAYVSVLESRGRQFVFVREPGASSVMVHVGAEGVWIDMELFWCYCPPTVRFNAAEVAWFEACWALSIPASAGRS
jgi:hypothetical protein